MKKLNIIFRWLMLAAVLVISLIPWFETVDLIYLASFGALEWPMGPIHATDHVVFLSYYILTFVVIIAVAVWGDFSRFLRTTILLFGLLPLVVSFSIHLGGGYRTYINCNPEYSLSTYMMEVATIFSQQICDEPWPGVRFHEMYYDCK